MNSSSHPLASPVFRLVRTLDLRFDTLGNLRILRAEIFQNPEQPTHFRFCVWNLRRLQVGISYPNEEEHWGWLPLQWGFYLPHMSKDSFVEAADVDAAERQLWIELQAQFQERYTAEA